MTKVVFETATLADAIKKAARVAPAKGAAFDKASGIVIDVDPSSSVPVVTRATDLEIYYMEWVDVLEVEGDHDSWRLPSVLLDRVLSSLPIGSGKTVTFERKDKQVFITSDRMRSRMTLMDSSYFPIWTAFDPDKLTPVTGMGGRLAMVEWAAAKDRSVPVLAGVYFNGELIAATDRFRMATAPLAVEGLAHPITIPAGILAPLLKQTGDVAFGFEGMQALLMPDEHTQIRVVAFGEEYPNILGAVKRDYPELIKVRKTSLIEMINRASAFGGNDRVSQPLRVFIGKEEIAVMIENGEIGMLGDVLDVPGQAVHERWECKFNPGYLLDALNAAPSDECIIGYDRVKKYQPLRIDGGSGYEAWVMPRRNEAAEAAT